MYAKACLTFFAHVTSYINCLRCYTIQCAPHLLYTYLGIYSKEIRTQVLAIQAALKSHATICHIFMFVCRHVGLDDILTTRMTIQRYNVFFVCFLFPRLPLDTGTRILHLSGIRWMFFCQTLTIQPCTYVLQTNQKHFHNFSVGNALYKVGGLHSCFLPLGWRHTRSPGKLISRLEGTVGNKLVIPSRGCLLQMFPGTLRVNEVWLSTSPNSLERVKGRFLTSRLGANFDPPG
jgi:hypothetical protein